MPYHIQKTLANLNDYPMSQQTCYVSKTKTNRVTLFSYMLYYIPGLQTKQPHPLSNLTAQQT